MSWPIISLGRGIPRFLLAGLAGFAICQLFASSAEATQLFTRFVDETAESFSLAHALATNLLSDEFELESAGGEPRDAAAHGAAGPGSRFDLALATHLIDARLLTSSCRAMGDRADPEGDESGVRTVSGESWFWIIANLATGSALSPDLSSSPVVATHAMGATPLTIETLDDSSRDEGTEWAKMMLLAQKPVRPDGYMMHEVTAALEEFATPEPDFLFLVFLAVQALWAIASRPRTT